MFALSVLCVGIAFLINNKAQNLEENISHDVSSQIDINSGNLKDARREVEILKKEVEELLEIAKEIERSSNSSKDLEKELDKITEINK